MKKIKIIQLFTRLKLFRYLCFVFCFLGIGLSFCSANICSSGDFSSFDSYNANSKYLGAFFQKNNISSDYLIDSFSFYHSSNTTNRIRSINVCYGNSYNSSATDWSSLISSFDCFNITGYTLTYQNNVVSITFNSSVLISSGFEYFLFYFDGGYSQQTFLTYSSPFSVSLDSSINFLSVWSYVSTNQSSRILYLTDICYNIITPPANPKFKINYGNTSYEYELEDNLSIHLKSPVVMSGTSEYIYAGSTGINLFYNGTSQRYSKDKLYLGTSSWYNNNIFTPVCL